jgi:hypothetical protein
MFKSKLKIALAVSAVLLIVITSSFLIRDKKHDKTSVSNEVVSAKKLTSRFYEFTYQEIKTDIGTFKIGDSIENLSKNYPEVQLQFDQLEQSKQDPEPSLRWDGGCFKILASGAQLIFSDGKKLDRVDITGQNYKNSDNIFVGVAQNKVIQAYPQAVLEPSKYDGTDITVRFITSPEKYVFHSLNGVIGEISFGVSPAIELVEGCL